MELIFKIIGIGIVTCFASLLIKPVRTDFAVIVGLVGGIIILALVMNYFTSIFSAFSQIIDKTGLNKGIFSIVLKIVAIGYLTEFSASICQDCGNNGLAEKMLLGGKVVLLAMSLPIVMDILDIVTELLPWKISLN